MVWNQTSRIMQDLFDNVWGAEQEIVVDHVLDITLLVRLFQVLSLANRHELNINRLHSLRLVLPASVDPWDGKVSRWLHQDISWHSK